MFLSLTELSLLTLGSYVHRRITSPVVHGRDKVEHLSQLSVKLGLSAKGLVKIHVAAWRK
jgi:hypothetical protein